MTSLIKAATMTIRHSWIDIQHAFRMASWIDEYLVRKFPKTAPIPLATTGLSSAIVLSTGTSALLSFAAGKAIHAFFKRFNPHYASLAGVLFFTAFLLTKLSHWATLQFRHLTTIGINALRDQIPYFITQRGPALEIDRTAYKHDIREQAADFLYRKLYVIYAVVSNGQPVKNLPDLKVRVNQSADLLERHLPYDLRKEEKKVLFTYINTPERTTLIEEAKNELFRDLMLSLDLAPPVNDPSSILEKKGEPLKLNPAKTEYFAKEKARDPDNQKFYNYQIQAVHQESVHDFLYRRLYRLYPLLNEKPVQNFLEFKDRLGKVAKLLDRHLDQGLTADEKTVLGRLTPEAKGELLESAKIELQADLAQHLHLTPTYEEIVRRTTPKERKALEKKLNSLPEQNIKALLTAIEEGNWDADIFRTKNFSLCALEAVRRGQLSQNDYATVQIFWEMTQMHPSPHERKMIALFNSDGTINEEAKTSILKTLKHDKKRKDQDFLLSVEQLDQFFEKMRQLPKIQQHIWLVPHLREPIIESIFTPVLAEVSPLEMMVAPMGLMQAFLDTAFGENAIRLNPVHGLSSWEDIRQGHLKGTRDFALHCSLVELPEKADGNQARWFYFGKHDFYHALLISSVPAVYRKYYVGCYDIIQKSLQKADLDKGAGILDMEATQFFDNFCFKKEDPKDVFWVQLAELIGSTAMAEKLYEVLKENPNPKPLSPEKQKQNREEIEVQKIVYANLFVSELQPIPEIQPGPKTIHQKAQKSEYSYLFDHSKILDVLATLSWPLAKG